MHHVFHRLLNLVSQNRNGGSPNNNGYYIPERYERPVHKGNRSLLFSIRFTLTSFHINKIYPKSSQPNSKRHNFNQIKNKLSLKIIQEQINLIGQLNCTSI